MIDLLDAAVRCKKNLLPFLPHFFQKEQVNRVLLDSSLPRFSVKQRALQCIHCIHIYIYIYIYIDTVTLTCLFFQPPPPLRPPSFWVSASHTNKRHSNGGCTHYTVVHKQRNCIHSSLFREASVVDLAHSTAAAANWICVAV